jgi:hypothetical protein
MTISLKSPLSSWLNTWGFNSCEGNYKIWWGKEGYYVYKVGRLLQLSIIYSH